jgi:hypothetical protein
MASYERSELTTAAALMYSNKELKEYAKDKKGLISLVEDIQKKIPIISGKNGNLQFGSSQIKEGFSKEIDIQSLEEKEKNKVIVDMAIGISAAMGIKEEIGSENLTAYMTGDVWPEDVQPFKVQAYGFKDYNSSDIMVTSDKKTFYGISLKKKNKPKAPDPTLINKAFDTALDETGLSPEERKKIKEMKEKVVQTRIDYFSNLVIRAVDEEKIIRWKDINKNKTQKISSKSEWDRWKKTKEGKEELFYATNRDKNLFGKYSYIDTKGYVNSVNGYLNDKTTDSKSMRFFVNKELSNNNSEIWKAFLEVMNNYTDIFSDILLNIILKTKLYKELTAKEIEKKGYKFRFYLVTGIGNIGTKGDVNIFPANVTKLETTLCGLTRIEEAYQNDKYEIILNTSQQDKSDAAKIYFKLKRGNLNILDLELRYKGSFNPQPQFQATINDEFKALLKKECE